MSAIRVCEIGQLIYLSDGDDKSTTDSTANKLDHVESCRQDNNLNGNGPGDDSTVTQ